MTARKAPAPLSIVPMTGDMESLPLPTAGPYFVITRNGVLIHKFFEFGRVLVPVREISSLAELIFDGKKASAMLWDNLDEKQIPVELIGKAWHFFRQVWNTHKSEAMVDITWHPEKGYRLFVPPQSGSMGGVDAKRDVTHFHKDSRHIGTIHSHCNFGAFHSGTDTHDADEHDGLHITIGNVDKNPPSIAIMISASKIRWDKKLEEICGTDKIPYTESPAWWLNQIKKGGTTAPKAVDTQTTHGWGEAAKTEKKNGQPNSGHAPSSERSIIPFSGSIEEAVQEGKRGNGRGPKSLTFNRVDLPRDLYGRSLEEVFYMTRLTNAQSNRMEDAINHLQHIDVLLASMGLQLDCGVIEGAPINDKHIEQWLKGEGF